MTDAEQAVCAGLLTLLQGSHSWGSKWTDTAAVIPSFYPEGTILDVFTRDNSTQGQDGQDVLVRLRLRHKTRKGVSEGKGELIALLKGAQTVTLAGGLVNFCTRPDGGFTRAAGTEANPYHEAVDTWLIQASG